VLLHAVDEGAPADVEEAGGVGLVAFELFESTTDQLAFDGFEADSFFRQLGPEGGRKGRGG